MLQLEILAVSSSGWVKQMFCNLKQYNSVFCHSPLWGTEGVSVITEALKLQVHDYTIKLWRFGGRNNTLRQHNNQWHTETLNAVYQQNKVAKNPPKQNIHRLSFVNSAWNNFHQSKWCLDELFWTVFNSVNK